MPACPRETFKSLHTCLDSSIAMAQWLSLPVEASTCLRFTFHACVRAHNGGGMLLKSLLMWRKGWECRCLYNYCPSPKHYLPSWLANSCTFLLHSGPCSFFTTGKKQKQALLLDLDCSKMNFPLFSFCGWLQSGKLCELTNCTTFLNVCACLVMQVWERLKEPQDGWNWL